MKNIAKIIILTFIFCSSCTKYVHDFSSLIIEDGKYDTEFPHRNCSKDLQKINQSTKMVTCIGYYTEHFFNLEDRTTVQDINLGKAVKTVNYNNTSTGTATIIYHNDNRFAMITCAHIVNAPDKIISYFDSPNENYVFSVAFLKRKMIFCTDIAVKKLEVLVVDDKIDIAILGGGLEGIETLLPVLDFPTGNSTDLNWGSFVYLFGYPRGYKMISHGIVSLSKKNIRKYFYVDSPFNRGFSGGLVMAIKDGVPNFEFIGIATSAAAEFYGYLSPNQNSDYNDHEKSFEPYQGKLYSKKLEMIMYGITQITSIDAIRNMWEKNQDYLESNGYYLDKFFQK